MLWGVPRMPAPDRHRHCKPHTQEHTSFPSRMTRGGYTPSWRRTGGGDPAPGSAPSLGRGAATPNRPSASASPAPPWSSWWPDARARTRRAESKSSSARMQGRTGRGAGGGGGRGEGGGGVIRRQIFKNRPSATPPPRKYSARAPPSPLTRLRTAMFRCTRCVAWRQGPPGADRKRRSRGGGGRRWGRWGADNNDLGARARPPVRQGQRGLGVLLVGATIIDLSVVVRTQRRGHHGPGGRRRQEAVIEDLGHGNGNRP